MQTLNWYIRRLQSMSAAEIAWRVGSLGRDWVDRVRIPLGWIPAIERAQAGDSVADVPRGFQLDRSPDGYAAADAEGQWLNELLSKADAISAGRLTWFDHRDRSLGDPIDWHRDHRADLQTERHLIQRIDYRDYSRNGDCKEVWEPNRHHQCAQRDPEEVGVALHRRLAAVVYWPAPGDPGARRAADGRRCHTARFRTAGAGCGAACWRAGLSMA